MTTQHLPLLLLLLLAGWAGAATFTSDGGTGPWNDGATWGNTSPGSEGTDYPSTSGGDSVVIAAGDSVWIPVGYAAKCKGYCQSSTSTNHTVLDIQGSLRLDGNFILDSWTSVYMRAGSTLDLDGRDFKSQADYEYLRLNLLGSAGSRVTVKSTATGGRFGHQAAEGYGYNYIEYADFQDVGIINWGGENDGVANRFLLRIRYSTFSNTGTITTRAFAGSQFLIERSDFYNTGDLTFRHSGTGTDSAIVQYNTFWDISGAATTLYLYLYKANSVVRGNFFKNVYMYEANATTANTFEKNLHCIASAVGEFSTVAHVYRNNYTYHRADNYRTFSGSNPQTVQNNVFEGGYLAGFTDPGNVILQPNQNLTASGNLIIDYKGGVFVSITSANNKVITINDNTLFLKDNTATGYLVNSEIAGALYSGAFNIYNNLIYSVDNSSGRGISLVDSTADQIDYTEFNSFFNVPDKYYQVVITDKTEGTDSTFGKFDIVADPQFDDTSRGLIKFNQVYGTTDAVEDSAYAYFLRMNGYNKNTKTQGTANTYTIDSLYAYVRAGFVVHNDSLTHGLADSTIGAMGYTASGPTISTHPADVSLNAGDTATYFVIATGTGTVTYQWQLKPNAGYWGDTAFQTNDTLKIRAVIGKSGDSVRCIVTDDNASDTSNAALLDVYVLPVITSVTPNKCDTSGGCEFTVRGQHFFEIPLLIEIGGAPVTTVLNWNDTLIIGIAPAGSHGAQNLVIGNKYLLNDTSTFTYTHTPIIITGLVSGQTNGGYNDTITGLYFGETGGSVSYGDSAATIVSQAGEQMVARVPAYHTIGTVNKILTNTDGNKDTVMFTYLQGPRIDSIAPVRIRRDSLLTVYLTAPPDSTANHHLHINTLSLGPLKRLSGGLAVDTIPTDAPRGYYRRISLMSDTDTVATKVTNLRIKVSEIAKDGSN